jgi:hypothetical protein
VWERLQPRLIEHEKGRPWAAFSVWLFLGDPGSSIAAEAAPTENRHKDKTPSFWLGVLRDKKPWR